MLTHLHIRNYALVDRLELELAGGFTVLTGETGAGKSILLGALGAALGERADTAAIRHGAARAEVVASLDVSDNPAAAAWLAEHELDDGEECLLRRTLSAEGRSKAYINGSPVTLQSLRTLGELLVDIHGQHEHQSLLRREHQLELLDGFAGHHERTGEVRRRFDEWKRLNGELEELQSQSAAGGTSLDLLRHQAGELDELNLTADELRELDEEHRRLANAGQLLSVAQASVDALYEQEDSVNARLARIAGELQQHLDTDPGLRPAAELLNGAAIQVDEAAAELRNYLERLELDPQRLEQLDRRLTQIHDIARKHRIRPAELPGLQRELAARLQRLEGAEQRLSELREEIETAERHYRSAAAELSKSRRRAAQALGRKVGAEMRRLGMPDGRFTVDIEPRDGARPSPAGLDRIELQVSTNPDQPPRPLAKVASGGELSRISLAIQVITARQGGVPTLIFDEVDVGIGGRVAEIVGQSLRALGGRRQVLCITHLPQVAALGHHHLQVSKAAGERTTTAIQALAREQRGEEIARMLGGIEISTKTREHAEELIKRAEEPAGSEAC